MNVYVCWDKGANCTDEVSIEWSVNDAKAYDNYFLLTIPNQKKGNGKCVGSFTVKEKENN